MNIRRMIFAFIGLVGSPIYLFGSIDRFVGKWEATGQGLTKIQIHLSDNQLRLHTFGACQPQDCDWGIVNANAYAPNVSASVREAAEAVSAIYETTFSRTILIIYSVDVNQLRVEKFTIFTDRSGRSPYHMTTILKRVE